MKSFALATDRSRSLIRHATLLLVAALLLCSPFPAQAEKTEEDSLASSPVWWYPEPVESIDEAAQTIVNLRHFFCDYGGRHVDEIVVDRDGLAISASITGIQQSSHWLPSYGGSWVGNRYVPYYGGTTVISQRPVTDQQQYWVATADVNGIELDYFPNRINKWGVSVYHRGSSQKASITVRTTDVAMARKFANAFATLAAKKSTLFLGHDLHGFRGTWNPAKDFRRLKWTRGAGFLVTGVVSGSPSEAAGLRADDIIFEIDGTALSDQGAYGKITYAALYNKPGATLSMQVFRAGQIFPVQLAVRNAQYAYALKSSSARPQFGVRTAEMTAADAAKPEFAGHRGVLIAELFGGTPAAGMGLKTGDLLLQVDDTPLSNTEELRRAVAKAMPARAKVLRAGRVIELPSKPGEAASAPTPPSTTPEPAPAPVPVPPPA